MPCRGQRAEVGRTRLPLSPGPCRETGDIGEVKLAIQGSDARVFDTELFKSTLWAERDVRDFTDGCVRRRSVPRAGAT